MQQRQFVGLGVVAWSGLMCLVGSTLQGQSVPLNAPFTDATARAPGLQNAKLTGMGWADLDGDGRLDFAVADWNGAHVLYHNLGDGSFETNVSISVPNMQGQGLSWADWNNDGQPDLLISSISSSANLLFRGAGGFQLERLTTGAIVDQKGYMVACSWGDYDNDGYPDLALLQINQRTHLLHNERNGTFTRVAEGELPETAQASIGCAWGDYDNDGRLDLFVANGGARTNNLFHNEGNGRFRKITEGPVVSDLGTSVTGCWGDYDNDGYQDLFVANRSGVAFLYNNNRNGTFRRVMEGEMVTESGYGNGCAWADYDNDGWLDLYVAGYPTGRLYHNNGNGTFTKITAGAPVELAGSGVGGCGAGWADYNGDGYVDLLVTQLSAGLTRLYRNEGGSNHWLTVKCTGTHSNRAGLGAKVRIKTVTGGVESWQLRELTAGDGWRDLGPWANFGLGGALEAALVRVEWPDGVVQELQNVAVDRLIEIVEQPPVLYARPPSGSFGTPVVAELISGLETGVIRYTLDGTEPTAASPAFTAPLRLIHSVSLKARVFTNDVAASEVLTQVYQINIPVPTITQEPQSLTVREGDPASFSVAATGVAPISYQWLIGERELAGETNASFALSAARFVDAGSYRVRVANDGGSTMSAAAELTVVPRAPFTNITAEVFASETATTLGLGWADLDGDGLLDFAMVDYSGTNVVYHGLGGGRFERSVALGDAGTACQGMSWGDWNNDGIPDLVIGGIGRAGNLLFRGQTNFGLEKVTSGAIPDYKGYLLASSWADYDCDGYLDLAMMDMQKGCRLFHNEKDGTFAQVTSGELVETVQNAIGCAWGDYDNDGRPDLFVANGARAANALFRNLGEGRFQKVAEGPVATDRGAAVTGCWGDYDNDGHLDLFVGNRDMVNFLYHNNGDGTFTRILEGEIATDVSYWNGCAWADYDNDGWLDLFVAGSPTSALYHNNGNGTFTRITAGTLVEESGSALCVAWGDSDNDGYQDLLVAHYASGGGRLYRNEGGTNRWLTVKCVGTLANRGGVGAKVWTRARIDGADRWQVREISTGDGWRDVGPWASFGLGDAAQADLLRVEWPSGVIQEFANLPANQTLTVTEQQPPLWLRPSAGAYSNRLEVTISSGIAEGTIRYTLDGGEPTVESAAYAGAVRLLASATVKARVFTNGVPASEIVSAAYQITLTPATITQQPQSQTVIEGWNVSLTVVATGSAPLAYQWLYNDTVLEGATNATLPLPAIKLAQAGTYKVRVSNDANTVTSDAAVLTVNPAPIPPTITQEPDNQSVVLGGRAVFRVVATGDQPMTYTWMRGSTPVYTAGPEYVLDNVQPGLAGNYRVKVSNAAGYKYSRTVTLTVTDAPVAPAITKAPTHQLVALDASANFAVTVTGTTPLEYEWRRNGQPIPGATNAIYSVAQAKPADEGTYTVMVRNPLGVATTATGAVLDLVDLPGARVAFLNRMAGILDAPVLDADGTTRLAGPGFLAQLYAGPDAQSLAPIGPASPFQTAAGAGYWDPGKTYVRTVPGVTSGSNVFAQVRAWETGAGTTFEQAYAGGRKTGKSAVLELATDPDGQSSAQLLGLLSFSLVYETEAPVVTITSPLAATVTDERFTLAGSVADNAGVASARWELNGAAMGALELQNGQFSLPDQKLPALTNEVKVIARDTSGNEGFAAVTVIWTPVREVALGSASALENAQLDLPLVVITGPSEVGGMSFTVNYDPEQFRGATFTWGPALAMGLREVNLETPGLVRGTFSLGGSALPAGAVTLGELSLRARSVPTNTLVTVDLRVQDVTDAAGNRLLSGTAVADAQIVVLRRNWLGDNNGNDRLDVGDATIIQRFLAALDPLRDGDVSGNDLNTSGDLDSGDVTKVLRVVVGLDEPTPTPIAAGGVVNQMQGPPDMVVVPVPLIAEAAAIVADPVSLSMGSIPPQAAPGGQVKVQLTLNQLATAPAFTGLSFDLAYPAAALKLVEAVVVPGLVPAGSVALWHDQGGRVKFAISSTAIWATGNGPVAEVTFEVLGLPADGNWRLEVSAMEIARAEGYELQTLSGTIWRLPPAPGSVWSAPVMTAKGLVFNFASQAEQSYAVEVSEDLTHWTLLATVPGTDGLTTFTDAEAGQLTMRFYRVKPAP